MTKTAALDPVDTPRVWTGSSAVRTLLVCALALLAAVVVKATLVETWYAPDDAMAPTVSAGERVLLTKVGGVERGDVVVVDVSEAFSGPSRATHVADGVLGSVLSSVADVLGVRNGERSVISRVAAVGGDTVTCCDGGEVRVGGAAVAKAPTGTEPFTLEVPKGSLWVVGDRPDVALDSLSQVAEDTRGVVPVEDVIGRAALRLWPLGGVS